MKKLLAVTLVAGLVSAQAAVESSSQETTSLSTETVSIQEVAPIATEKKWSASLETENYKGISKGNTSYDGDIEAWEKAEVRYKLTDRDSVSLAQEWSRRYGRGAGNEVGTTLQDTSVRYTRSGYKLPSDIGYAVQGRVYVPTSEGSRDGGQIAQFRLYNIFSKELAKNLTAELLINPRLFVQDGSSVNDVGTKRFRLLNSAGLKYSITEKVAVETTLGVYSKWKNGVARSDFLDASTSVYYSPATWVDLAAGIRQSDEASDTRVSGAELYSADQSEYYVIATFKM